MLKVGFWNFLYSLQFALISYFLMDYFKTLGLAEKNISIVFFLMSFFGFLASFFAAKIIIKYSLRNIFLFSILSIFIFHFLWIFFEIKEIVLISFLFYSFFTYLIWIILDILLERRDGGNERTGNSRGLYLTLGSLAFIIGPFLAGLLLKTSFNLMWLTGLFIYFIFLFSFLTEYKKIKKIEVKNNFNFFVIKEKILKNNHLNIFSINFFLNFFYSVMVFYTAFYLHNYLNFTFEEIGLILAIILTPFVFMSLPLGKISDNWLGEKELLFLGFMIMVVSVFFFGYLKDFSFFLVTFILFLTRIGAAMVQTMTDIYFFRNVDGEDMGLISFYRSLAALANMAGPFFGFIILLFLDISWIFIILSLILIIPFYFVLKLKDSK